MNNNSIFTKSKKEKNDEFYTRLEDIEKELRYYENQFKDKVVLCNCDDPYKSNFFKYFLLNFKKLGLKKLISTCYNGCEDIPLFDDDTKVVRKAYKAVISIDKLEDINEDDILSVLSQDDVITELKGNGSFDSPECIKLLKECDIVCTNPPFSLFRKFIDTIMTYDKKFLVLGTISSITYKSVFPLIKNNKMWLGMTPANGMYFYVPNEYKHVSTYNSETIKDGRKVIRVPAICWFTNLKTIKRNNPLNLTKIYKGNESYYPKYDDYDAINVDKVDDIPEDYDGVIGVPVTFLDKYCPQQFKIVGMVSPSKIDEYNLGYSMINGKYIYARLLIQKI